MSSLVKHSGFQLLLVVTSAYVANLIGCEGAFQGLAMWYPALAKPAWAYRLWMFAPTWTIVFGLIALGAWIGLQAQVRPRFLWSAGFAGLIALLAAWPWTFFAAKQLSLSAGVAIATTLVCLAMAGLGFRYRPMSGVLLTLALLWCGYETILTVTVDRSNGQNSTVQVITTS